MTIAQWHEDPSRKLDALIHILQYHLHTDGRPPLQVVDDTLVPSDGCTVQEGSPDKIIIYSAFPSSNLQLLKVSKSHFFKPHSQLLIGFELARDQAHGHAWQNQGLGTCADLGPDAQRWAR